MTEPIIDPATLPNFPALKDVGMRDSRDDMLPWQAQQLDRLGYEGPPPRDQFEAYAFIDRLKPIKAAPGSDDPEDLTAEQLDEMYA